MTHKLLINLSCAVLLLSGCKQFAYYQSPFHANNSSYKVMPVAAEKPVAETHISGALATGGAGHELRDGSWTLHSNLYRSHSAGNIRAFYGLTGSIGAYRVRSIGSNDINSPDFKYPNDSLISARAGGNFFAGLGGTAGIYVAKQMTEKNEWRIIGLETNYTHEFGEYQSFRNELPDTAVNLISRSKGYFTLGLHSDAVFKSKRGTKGIKWGWVFTTRTLTEYSDDGVPSTLLPSFLSVTYHYTRDRTAGFWQLNAGKYTLNLMFGMSYRLGK